MTFHRNGSARPPTDDELAPLIYQQGREAGVLDGKLLHFVNDTPLLTIGGANSAKFTRAALCSCVSNAVRSMFVLDVKGQALATTWHWNLEVRTSPRS